MDLVIDLLELVNSFARGIGSLILGAVRLVVPAMKVPEDLSAPLGWLALLTVGLAVAEVAKKLAWVAVGVGWLLITVRIVMVMVGR